jgi:hypothetical protein
MTRKVKTLEILIGKGNSVLLLADGLYFADFQARKSITLGAQSTIEDLDILDLPKKIA